MGGRSQPGPFPATRGEDLLLELAAPDCAPGVGCRNQAVLNEIRFFTSHKVACVMLVLATSPILCGSLCVRWSGGEGGRACGGEECARKLGRSARKRVWGEGARAPLTPTHTKPCAPTAPPHTHAVRVIPRALSSSSISWVNIAPISTNAIDFPESSKKVIFG